MLRQSNATIERTIREIKEAKADKEKTKAARKKVEDMKQKVTPRKTVSAAQTGKADPKGTPKVLRDFRDLRLLKGGVPDTPATPQNTSVRSAVRKRTLSFERTLDIRGLRADGALERLIAYMDDALMVGAGEVTILHGTGTGALKQLTRDYLASLNHQRRKRGQVTLDYGDGDPNHGGAGLTIVKL
jgi:DNA mismatch repair protein MutS2